MVREIAAQLDRLLPLATEWAKKQEEHILDKGDILGPRLLKEAAKAGVMFPEKIRILIVPKIPIPQEPLLNEACKKTRLISEDTIALTLGYGILIRQDCAGKRKPYIHELAHVAQYERLGSIYNFLKAYLHEIIQFGYSQAPMEKEANNKTKKPPKKTS